MTIVNHEYFVSLEVAKLLKQVGFDWKCEQVYYIGDGIDGLIKYGKLCDVKTTTLNNKMLIYAPTLDVAQRWLREVREIEVNTLCVYINNVKKYSYSVFDGKYNNERIEEGFNTYEEAQEAGIKKALEIILEEGK